MALSFPLSRVDFLDLLPIQDVQFSAPAQLQHNQVGGGEILTAEVAPALWQGVFTLAPMPARTAAEIEGLLAALQVPGRAFYAYKKNQIGPASDPVGAALSGSSPTIKAIDLSGSRLQLQALPAAFVMSAGDYLSFAYGTSPVRQALHRVQEDITATAGDTGYFEVIPHLRGGATSAAIELIKPYCKAVIVPGSVSFGATRNGITSGVQFSFRQSLR